MATPSTDAVPPPASTRSRRRQRPLSSENSIAQPKAKRQRSALNEHTFTAPDRDASAEMQEVGPAKSIASISRRESTRAIQRHSQDLAVRGKKLKVAERGIKGDGSVVLVCCCVVVFDKSQYVPCLY
jgi:nuclear pore complex protein Nup133